MDVERAHWDSLTGPQRDGFLGVLYALGTLGILGSVSILVFYVMETVQTVLKRRRRRRKNLEQKPFFVTSRGDPGKLAKALIFSLALSDLIVTLSFLLSSPRPEFTATTKCKTQAALQDISELAQFWIVASYSHHLYMVFVHQSVVHTKWFIVYFALILVYPTVWVTINLASGFYGPAGLWCWITEDHSVLRWVEYYGLVILVFVFNLVLFILILRKIRELKRQYGKNVARPSAHSKDPSVGFQFTLYILVYLITKFPGIANRIQNEVSPRSPSYPFEMAQVVPSLLQGALDALIYNFTFCRRRWRLRRLRKNAIKEPNLDGLFDRSARMSLLDEEYGAPPPRSFKFRPGVPLSSSSSASLSSSSAAATAAAAAAAASPREGGSTSSAAPLLDPSSAAGNGTLYPQHAGSGSSSSLSSHKKKGLLEQLEEGGNLVRKPEKPSFMQQRKDEDEDTRADQA